MRTRRDFLSQAALTAGAMAVGTFRAATTESRVSTATNPQRILILGGTGFIGPHFVAALAEHGHSITLFNRGRGPAPQAKVEQLIGDRSGQLDALKGRNWDFV